MFKEREPAVNRFCGTVCALLVLLALIGCGGPAQPHTLATVLHPVAGSPTARIVSKPFEVHGVAHVVAKFSLEPETTASAASLFR